MLGNGAALVRGCACSWFNGRLGSYGR